MSIKLTWAGTVFSIQPRIRLVRSFDQRDHSYLGYSLRVDGLIDGVANDFSVGIGKALQAKQAIRSGDTVGGECSPVENCDLETVGFYKVSKFKVISRSALQSQELPPVLTVPPPLLIYRQRGHRRLSPRTYEASCMQCIWGCQMAVTLIIDHWNPANRKYRKETFCYGPKSCELYRSGPPRKVPGRKGMTWTEEDWVDEDATRHRREDE